jgi:UDP-N-acetyl-D-mannosaminuronic acid transferase (WecB/TagA/CpsF family)
MTGDVIPSWFDDDLPCKGQTSVMFAGDKADGTAAAKAICASCSHTVECLAYAVAHGIPFGVWGGQGAMERQGRPPVARTRNGVARCGTRAGYSRHQDRGEAICEECRHAYNEARRQWRARTRMGVVA